MGSRSSALSDSDKEFILQQKLFFIASSSGSEVNLSPKGYECLRVINNNALLYLDYAGSGNRTARDIEAEGEITVMFTAFDSPPMILRLFCKGEIVDKEDQEMQKLFSSIDLKGMRQFIKLRIYCVEHSCGMSVPRYEFVSDRHELKEWCQDEDRDGRLDTYVSKNAIPPDLNEFRP